MPSPPKIPQTIGQVGMVEVEHDTKAHGTCHTACHIRVPAEIKIDLPGKGQCSQDQGRSLEILR